MAFSIEIALGYLERAQAHNRLAHAYLICAPQIDGAQQLAVRAVKLINGDEGGETLDALESEYVRMVRPVSKSRRITVAQIRELERSLHLAAPAGKTKIGVIVEADRMPREAANAFLKTLEEPPAKTVLLLLSAHPEQLLDTILSRCIRIDLTAGESTGRRDEGQTALIEALRGHFADHEDGGVSGALGFADRFASLLKRAKASIAKEHGTALKGEIETYKQRTEGDWLDKREDHYKALTESEYVAKRNALVEMLLLVVGDALRQQHGGVDRVGLDVPELGETTRKMAAGIPHRELLKRIAALESLRSNLETNANEKLAMEVAFLQAFG